MFYWNIFCIFQFLYRKAKEEVWKCQRSFEESRRDEMVKTDAKFWDCAAFFIKGQKKEERSKTEDPREKGGQVGLEPANGPA